MFYNVLKMKDIASDDTKKLEKVTLLENGQSRVCVVRLNKDEIIDTHTSDSDAMVCVADGEIEMHFDAQKFTIKEGELLMFKKDTQHKVLAKKDSKFLLVRV